MVLFQHIHLIYMDIGILLFVKYIKLLNNKMGHAGIDSRVQPYYNQHKNDIILVNVYQK